MGETGRTFVVAGPSGAGKDTLIRRVLKTLENVHYSVSATTREPSRGEVDGRDYYFLSDSRFDELLEQDAFVEWEEVFGKRYGTLKSEIEPAKARGQDVLLELDTRGALNIKSKIQDALLIFIMPPSLKDLEDRLKGRKRDRTEDIRMRTDVATQEIEVGERDFDLVIVNDDIDRAYEELDRVMREEKARHGRKEDHNRP